MHHQTDSEPRLKNDSITWDGSAGRVTDTLQRSFNKIEDNFDTPDALILSCGKIIMNIVNICVKRV